MLYVAVSAPIWVLAEEHPHRCHQPIVVVGTLFLCMFGGDAKPKENERGLTIQVAPGLNGVT